MEKWITLFVIGLWPLIRNSRKIIARGVRGWYQGGEEGGGKATCGNAECGGFEVSCGARDICIPAATGLLGCCRWI